MKIIISGALGRMGRELTRAARDANLEIVGGVDVAYSSQASDFPIVTEYAQLAVKADVLIDFSNVSALPMLLAYGVQARLPLVLCTTGYTQTEQFSIEQAADCIPILQSANMSLGINVMQQLVTVAARALGEEYDVEIIEKHHKQKLDSPSGTALMLYESVRAARNSAIHAVYGRHGRIAKRSDSEIGIHAIRGGTVTGEHEVGFYGKSEELLITHRAENRALLAEGALRAAQFLQGKPKGQFTMQDVVIEMLKA